MRLRWWGIDIMLIDSSVWQRQVHKHPVFPSSPLDLLSCDTLCFFYTPFIASICCAYTINFLLVSVALTIAFST